MYAVPGLLSLEGEVAHYKVQVRLQKSSGVPEDAAINVWHCDALSLPNGYEDFVDDLITFYNAIDNTVLSSNFATTGHTLTVYKMSDPTPRAPVVTTPMTLALASTAMIPEAAICVSFQGERESGVSQARRRGRVYIGPLANVTSASNDPTVASATITTLANAATALVVASNTSVTYDWCVYSTVDQELVPVTNGWVDNAFDIQRRRGFTASSRTVWS